MLTGIVADTARNAFAAQLAVLHSCPDVISRLLKTGRSVIQAAKVLVISRLLHTKLSRRSNPPPFLDKLRNQLASLRRRLLVRIDRRFKSLGLSRENLVEAMCAFSLATSSSLNDVVRHYHHTRLEAISERLGKDTVANDDLLLALQLYAKTLKDTQTVIPGQLAHALEKLKAIPLFRSQDVYSLMELNLDVHERWIGDDIKAFTLYIRQDDLTKVEAEMLLKQWATQAVSNFLSGLRKRIEVVKKPPELLDLRRQVLELWLSDHHHSTCIDSAETLDGLRNMFIIQAVRLIQSSVSKLDHVGSFVHGVLQNWQPGISDSSLSLWDASMTSMEISTGSKAFRESILNRSLGKNESLAEMSVGYARFLGSIESLEEMIQKLRETGWDGGVDELDNEDNLLDNKRVLLSEDDPRLLQEELNNALHERFAELQTTLHKLHDYFDKGNRGQQAAYLIRTWRELRQHLPNSYQNAGLGLSSIPVLQSTLADEALRIPLERCSRRVGNLYHVKSQQARPLWEGDPELPILPSAWLYRFLFDLASSMTALGGDLWTPQATDALKRALIPSITPLVQGVAATEPTNGRVNGELSDIDETKTEDEVAKDVGEEELERGKREGKEPMNGENLADNINGQVSRALANGHPVARVKEEPRDAKIQRLFDICYLINATAVKDMNPEDNELIELQENLEQVLALDSRGVGRVKKDAGEYWKRTSLLFALLA